MTAFREEFQDYVHHVRVSIREEGRKEWKGGSGRTFISVQSFLGIIGGGREDAEVEFVEAH